MATVLPSVRAAGRLACVALWIIPASAASAAPTVSFTPHRGTTGSNPAPLYVHFDATASQSSNADANHFADMLYAWDFGDPSSGNWATNDLPRNRAFGGVAGHVYEQPGSYTITLTVTDTDGTETTVQEMITVTDPDEVWGDTTACVSVSEDFTGCPTAEHLTSSDFTAAMNALASQGYRRILFRRGDTFVADAPWATPSGKTEAMVSAFGNGARPNIRIGAGNSHSAIILQGSSVDVATAGGWRFVDLQITSESPTSLAWGISTSYLFDEALLYKMDIGPTGFGFNFGPDQSGLSVPHDYYAVVDTELRGNTGVPVDDGGSCFFGGADHLFISGVTCGQANLWQMRISYTNKAVFSNNIVAEHAGAYEAIKMNCGIGSLDAPGLVCSNMIFSDNVLAKEHLNLGTGSQENQATIANSIFERNLLPFGISTTHPDNVTRYNVLGGINIRPRQSPTDSAQPRNNVFEQNVCDRRGVSIAPSCVFIEPGVEFDGLLVRNNIVYAPGDAPQTLLANNSEATGSITEAGNVSTTESPFVVADPDPLVRTDYALAPGSPHVDQGEPVSFRTLDLLGNPTPEGRAVDVGAVEFQVDEPSDDDSGGASDTGGGGTEGGASESSAGEDGSAASEAESGGDSGSANGGASGDDGGCGCRVGPRAPWMIMAIGIATLRRRRSAHQVSAPAVPR